MPSPPIDTPYRQSAASILAVCGPRSLLVLRVRLLALRSLLEPLLLRAGARGGGQRLAAEHRPRGLRFAHQAQAPGAAREQVADQLLEVVRRRLEGLLEGPVDLAVGLGDHRAKLAHRGLEV